MAPTLPALIKSFAAITLTSCAAIDAPPEPVDRTGTNPTILLDTVQLTNGVAARDDDRTLDIVTSGTYTMDERRMALTFTAPVRAVEFGGETEIGLGDVSLAYAWLADLDEDQGVVFGTRLTFDTASESVLGDGQLLVAPSVTWTNFLTDRSLVAARFEQEYGDGRGDEDTRNRSHLGVRYVRAAEGHTAWWAVDPNLVVDFEDEAATWGELAVERGWLLGDVRGGAFSAFLRPTLGLGGRRELDWGLLLGLRLAGL